MGAGGRPQPTPRLAVLREVRDHSPTYDDLTGLLIEWCNGRREALDELMPLVYPELERLARSYLRRERSDHTLQTSALIGEAYLRLVDQDRVQWQNRGHFFGICAQMMRRILVDYARRHKAAKRPSAHPRITYDDQVGPGPGPEVDVLDLHEALNKLAEIDPRQSRVVELRYFGGLTIEETAAAMEVAPSTIKREWATAKAWLHRELARG